MEVVAATRDDVSAQGHSTAGIFMVSVHLLVFITMTDYFDMYRRSLNVTFHSPVARNE